MTKEDFIAAIIAAPADPLPRLAYADWLEENGHDERAAQHRDWAEKIKRCSNWFIHRCYELKEPCLNTDAFRAHGGDTGPVLILYQDGSVFSIKGRSVDRFDDGYREISKDEAMGKKK